MGGTSPQEVEELICSIAPTSRLLFHPSSCFYFSELDDIPFDAAILCSQQFRENVKHGKTYCLRADNNMVLGLLARSGLKIDCFSVIRDGCMEGGNYECVLGWNFFGRLMPVLVDSFEFHRDHGFRRLDIPAQFRSIPVPAYHQTFVKHSSPVSKVRSFLGHLCPVEETEACVGRIKVVVRRDSIWSHITKADLVIHAVGNCGLRGTENYVSGLLPQGKDDPRLWLEKTRPLLSIGHILEHARQRELSNLVLGPLANGVYSNIISEIRAWSHDFPKQLTFCHLGRKDLQQLRDLARI